MTHSRTVAAATALADLPIDAAEAMYSPDFVELATLAAGGLPLALPMSFTLDLPGNCVRFSSPLMAARLAHLARDPRCAVSFSRVTAGHQPVLLQGVATLGDLADGVRRGPARRFSVRPTRVLILSDPVQSWRFANGGDTADMTDSRAATERTARTERRASSAAVTAADLEALAGFDTTVIALRDADGWPVSLPVEPRRDDGQFVARVPHLPDLRLVDGPASLLGHTWTRAGPRFLAFTGRTTIDGPALRFRPGRALRRG